MTSIERLQISGIRSFEPSLTSRQTIYFQKPLTVILGKNGAGKTTIIEALLNACAGIMPPGSGQEKVSFIYDPQIIGESEVKAQIRLVFSARDGKMVQVIRSFKVSRMRNKTSFSTLDNTVAYEDPVTKKVISSTYKASQVDRVIPEMLGVSPAVLEHVIFCHQEASNWPLSSPLEVKKIFDEIFSATRYVLALERFRESGKEYRQELKEQEGNLRELREHREQAQGLRALLKKKTKLVQEIQQRISETRPRLQKLQSVLSALSSVDQQVEELIREAAVLEGRVQERRETLQRSQKEFERDHNTEEDPFFLGKKKSLDTLEEQCQECQGRITDLGTFLNSSQNDLGVLEHQLEVSNGELQHHNNIVHQLEKEEYQHHQYCSDLRNLLNSSYDGLCEKLFVDEFMVNETVANHAVRVAKTAVEEAQKEIQEEIQILEDKINGEEGKRQMVLRRLDINVKEREMKEELIEQLKHRIEAAQSELHRLLELNEYSSPSFSFESCIVALTEEIEREEKCITDLKEIKKQGPHYQSVEHLRKELEWQSAKVARLRDVLGKRRAVAGRDADIKELQRRLIERRESVRSQLSHLSSSFSFSVMANKAGCDDESGEVCEESLNNQYKNAVHEVECALREASGKYSLSSSELSSAQQLLFITMDRRSKYITDITHYEAELASIREEVLLKVDWGEILGREFLLKFEICLSETSEKKEKLQHELNVLRAKSKCFSELWAHALTHKTCPLCQRHFDSDASGGVESFFSHNSASCEDLLNAEKALESATEEWKTLQEILPLVEKARMVMFQIEKLREQQCSDESELNLDKLKSNLHELESDVSSEKERLDAAEAAKNILLSLRGAMTEIEKLESELSRMTRDCATVPQNKNDVENAGMNLDEENECISEHVSIEETMDLYEAAMAIQQDLHAQLSLHQRAWEGEADEIAKYENSVQRKKDKLSQLQRDDQHRRSLEDTIEQLTVEMSEWKNKCETLAKQLPSFQSSSSRSAEVLKSLREEKAEAEVTGKQRILECQQRASHLELALEKVARFIQSNGFQCLKDGKEKVTQLTSTLHNMRDKLCSMHNRIQSTRNEQKKMEETLKKLLTCRDIRTQEISLYADEERLKEINGKLVALKGSQLYGVEDILGPEAQKAPLSQLRESIREKLRHLEKTQSQQEGNMETLREDIEQLQKELESEKYRDIEKRFKFTFVQVETTGLTIKDIDKYYFALATAVQSYHQEKMILINRIIADLWRQTYLGSDIDAIEIRSETEKTFNSSGRRNYNYRVIMKRGSREIDMRGRCSAGQKVLASIIIRLALSEVFCYDCGILALDEPTTNLDEENSRSLAEALRVLIESRRNVRHFQLIVITHDEQFVRALGGHAVDRFYFVLKDREGAFSVIEERTFDQLFI